ncbi:MAG TPA: aldehyde dehydrogenase family protein [bacterium]|nr:aldehyde dehydrogenase family protein [bacterium]
MDCNQQVSAIVQQAKACCVVMRQLGSATKSGVLLEVARQIRSRGDFIQQENRKDLEFGRSKGLSPALLERLELTPKRIEEMATGVEEIVALPDPVGEVTRMWRRPNGMQVGRMRVPLGVIAIIYESRPNVTIDAASLCFKSGNVSVLRGGSEAAHSNEALISVFRRACVAKGVPAEVVSSLGTTERDAVQALLKMDAYVDVVIPRGGKSLIRNVMENSTIPVIKHYEVSVISL